jgi:hypothetical protein
MKPPRVQDKSTPHEPSMSSLNSPSTLTTTVEEWLSATDPTPYSGTTTATTKDQTFVENAENSIPLLTSFTYFPKLPTELRLRIWRCVPLDQRIVTIKREKNRLSTILPILTPPLLHVCHESRQEMLKHYKLLNLHLLPISIWKGMSFTATVWRLG